MNILSLILIVLSLASGSGCGSRDDSGLQSSSHLNSMPVEKDIQLGKDRITIQFSEYQIDLEQEFTLVDQNGLDFTIVPDRQPLFKNDMTTSSPGFLSYLKEQRAKVAYINQLGQLVDNNAGIILKEEVLNFAIDNEFGVLIVGEDIDLLLDNSPYRHFILAAGTFETDSIGRLIAVSNKSRFGLAEISNENFVSLLSNLFSWDDSGSELNLTVFFRPIASSFGWPQVARQNIFMGQPSFVRQWELPHQTHNFGSPWQTWQPGGWSGFPQQSFFSHHSQVFQAHHSFSPWRSEILAPGSWGNQNRFFAQPVPGRPLGAQFVTPGPQSFQFQPRFQDINQFHMPHVGMSHVNPGFSFGRTGQSFQGHFSDQMMGNSQAMMVGKVHSAPRKAFGLRPEFQNELVGASSVIHLKNPADREQFRVFFDNEGVAHRGSTTGPKITDPDLMFVMDSKGSIYAGRQQIGRFHHSSFLAGGPVNAAGHMKFGQDGKLLQISNESGHYRPSAESNQQVLDQLATEGVHLQRVDVREMSEFGLNFRTGQVIPGKQHVPGRFAPPDPRLPPQASFDRLKSTDLNTATKPDLETMFLENFNIPRNHINGTFENTRLEASFKHPTSDTKAVFIFPRSEMVAGKGQLTLKDYRVRRMLQMAQHHSVEIRMVDSVDELKSVLKENKNIKYLEIGSHAEATRMHIGSDFNSGYLTKDNIDADMFSNVREDATVFLHGCNTGCEARAAGRPTIAQSVSENIRGAKVVSTKDYLYGNHVKSDVDANGNVNVQIIKEDGVNYGRIFREGADISGVKTPPVPPASAGIRPSGPDRFEDQSGRFVFDASPRVPNLDMPRELHTFDFNDTLFRSSAFSGHLKKQGKSFDDFLSGKYDPDHAEISRFTYTPITDALKDAVQRGQYVSIVTNNTNHPFLKKFLSHHLGDDADKVMIVNRKPGVDKSAFSGDGKNAMISQSEQVFRKQGPISKIRLYDDDVVNQNLFTSFRGTQPTPLSIMEFKKPGSSDVELRINDIDMEIAAARNTLEKIKNTNGRTDGEIGVISKAAATQEKKIQALEQKKSELLQENAA